MKKIALLLALVLALGLTACDAPANDSTPTTTAKPNGETQTQTNGNQQPTPETAYAFEFGGVKLIPGKAFNADALPKADFVYEVPSCAIEGTDQVYSYGVMEVTAFDDGSGPVIYSIFLTDANTPTGEGLYIGDPQTSAAEIYGEDCTADGNQYIYQANGTMLILLTENGFITSIEYRMVTE